MSKLLTKFAIVLLMYVCMHGCSDDGDISSSPGGVGVSPSFVEQPMDIMLFNVYAEGVDNTFSVANYDQATHLVRTTQPGYECKAIATSGNSTTFAVVRKNGDKLDFKAANVEIVWGDKVVTSNSFTIYADAGASITRPATVLSLPTNMKGGKDETAVNFTVTGFPDNRVLDVADIEIEAVNEVAEGYITPSVTQVTANKEYKITFKAAKDTDLLTEVDNSYRVKIRGLYSDDFTVRIPKTASFTGFSKGSEVTSTGDDVSPANIIKGEGDSFLFPLNYASTNLLTINATTSVAADINTNNVITVKSVTSLAADDAGKIFTAEATPDAMTIKFNVKDGMNGVSASEEFEVVLSNGQKRNVTMMIAGSVAFGIQPPSVTMPFNAVVGDSAKSSFTIDGVLLDQLTIDDLTYVGAEFILPTPADGEPEIVAPLNGDKPYVGSDYIDNISFTESTVKGTYDIKFALKQVMGYDYPFEATYKVTAEGVDSEPFVVRIEPQTTITKVTIGGKTVSEDVAYNFPYNFQSSVKIVANVVLSDLENILANPVKIKSVETSNTSSSTYYDITFDGTLASLPLKLNITPKGVVIPEGYTDKVTVTLTNDRKYTFSIAVAPAATVIVQPSDIEFKYNIAKAATAKTTFRIAGVASGTSANNLTTKIVLCDKEGKALSKGDGFYDHMDTAKLTVSGIETVTASFTTLYESPYESLEGYYYVEIAGAKTEVSKITLGRTVLIESVTSLSSSGVAGECTGGPVTKNGVTTATYTQTINTLDKVTYTVNIGKDHKNTNSIYISSAKFSGTTAAFDYTSNVGDLVDNPDGTQSFTFTVQPKTTAVKNNSIIFTVVTTTSTKFNKTSKITIKYVP